MEKKIKRVNVSPKRQITIPKDFYDYMDIRNSRVQIYLDGKKMIVEPVSIEDDLFDFTEQIKAKLEKEGYTGLKLAAKLLERQRVVDKALSDMIKEAEEDYKSDKTVSHKELFSETTS